MRLGGINQTTGQSLVRRAEISLKDSGAIDGPAERRVANKMMWLDAF